MFDIVMEKTVTIKLKIEDFENNQVLCDAVNKAFKDQHKLTNVVSWRPASQGDMMLMKILWDIKQIVNCPDNKS